MKSQGSLLSIHTASLPTTTTHNNNNLYHETTFSTRHELKRRSSVEGPIPVDVFRGNALEKVNHLNNFVTEGFLSYVTRRACSLKFFIHNYGVYFFICFFNSVIKSNFFAIQKIALSTHVFLLTIFFNFLICDRLSIFGHKFLHTPRCCGVPPSALWHFNW